MLSSHLHKEVVDAGQAVGGTHVLLLVPLVHEWALVLRPELSALLHARRQHGLADLWGGGSEGELAEERSDCVELWACQSATCWMYCSGMRCWPSF